MAIRELTIKNTLTGKKELFKPIVDGRVGMYVCGPTVYGVPHLGHARAAISFDIVFRYLKFLGYKVRYVRNITDVGHLEDEHNETGEDKIAKKARLEQLEPMEVAQFYTNEYHKAMQQVNTLQPSIETLASGHIIEQIETIEKIIANGWAYEVNGSVYFDVLKYAKSHDYGVLSGRVLEDLLSNTRELTAQDEKKNATDFALWKNAEPQHIMKWNSPWGKGFPGWHVECTAMSQKYLGNRFDIHGGGMDLKFPHHEAEIAQAVGACGHHPVNYWMHNNMITLDSEKMSKSKGNFISLEEMFAGNHERLEQAYSPATVRFFMLQSHYSSPLDFSNNALQAAEKAMTRLTQGYQVLQELDETQFTGDGTGTVVDKINKNIEQAYVKMCDDFNTAETLAHLFDLSSVINSIHNKQIAFTDLDNATFVKMKTAYHDFLVEVLGVEIPVTESGGGDAEAVLDILLDVRDQMRTEKNYAMSDKIRDGLNAAGIDVKDRK